MAARSVFCPLAGVWRLVHSNSQSFFQQPLHEVRRFFCDSIRAAIEKCGAHHRISFFSPLTVQCHLAPGNLKFGPGPNFNALTIWYLQVSSHVSHHTACFFSFDMCRKRLHPPFLSMYQLQVGIVGSELSQAYIEKGQ